MSFWDKLKKSRGEEERNLLGKKLAELLPHVEAKRAEILSGIAGLMVRVAGQDMVIHESEKQSIKVALAKWTSFSSEEIDSILQLTLEETQKLAGLENHVYSQILRENLEASERYKILETLFSVAASDGTVENMESEEIRSISKGLNLTHQDFISARAQVIEFLGALKK